MQGIDISSWQTGIDLAAVPCDFAIVKATGGTGYINPDCTRAVEQARSLGKPFGFYHYAREVGYKSTPEAEAQFFINTCSNWFGQGIPVLDWEEELILSPAWAAAWLDYVYTKTGIRPLIYMSKSVCRSYDWSSIAPYYSLWYAQYPNYVATGYRDSPWTDSGGLGAWGHAVMFQYTSSGRLNSWGGSLDLNIFYGDAAAWDAIAKGDDDMPSPQEIADAVWAKAIAHKGGKAGAMSASEMLAWALQGADLLKRTDMAQAEERTGERVNTGADMALRLAYMEGRQMGIDRKLDKLLGLLEDKD